MTIRRAEGAEIEAAQRLRYRTYVEEKAWGEKVVDADHEHGILAEALDTHPASRIYCFGPDGQVHGALRVTAWAPGAMPAERRHLYSLELVPELEGLSVAEISNFMVEPALRKTLAPVALMVAAFTRTAREERVDAVLMFCTPGLLPRYLGIGLRPYGGRPIPHLTGALIPLVGLTVDFAHSLQRRSVMAVPQLLLRLARAPRPGVDVLARRLDADRSLETRPEALRRRLDRVRAGAPESWLASLDEALLDALAYAGLALYLPHGTVLVEPEVAQQEVYIVLEGRCEAFLGDAWVRPMGPGSLFGELALLRPDGRRTASVRSVGETQVLMLPRRFIERLAERDPQAALAFSLAMARLLAERLAESPEPARRGDNGTFRAELRELPVYRRAEPPVDAALLLDANEHPGPLPPAVEEAIVAAVAEAVAANRYPDAKQARLRAAGAAYVAASAGLEALSPESLSFGAGSDEIIRALLLGTCGGGRGRVLVAEPTFGMVAVVARAVGGGVARIGRLADGGLDTEAAAAALADDAAAPVRMVYVAHPNSPTGRPLLARERDWLRALPPELLVVIDEAYFELSGDTLVDEALRRPAWVVVRTLSKGFGLAAWRVGYAVGGAAVIEHLERLRLPFNLSTGHQAAAIVAFERHAEVLSAIAGIRAQRDRLFAWLEAHPATRPTPSAANFVYTEVARAGERAAALAERGVMVSRAGGGLRLTAGSASDTDRLLAALAEVLVD